MAQSRPSPDRPISPILELSVEEVLRLGPEVVDLRSPSEFAEDHLPGARNVPLFDDGERALVGTLYKQVGPEQAHGVALERTRENAVELVRNLCGGLGVDAKDLVARVERIAEGGVRAMENRLAGRPARTEDFAGGSPELVLCCWRGGLRSRSVAALLAGLGLHVAVVRGGYKAYRHHVLAVLDGWCAPKVVVLRGLTGVGKTLVLRALERRLPGSTVDLEGLAGHRSSILGAVGLRPVTQKAFDSALAGRLGAGFPHGVLVVEGESRKVGDLVLPERLWQAMEGGLDVELVAPMERRVEVLLDDYLAVPGAREELVGGLRYLESRLGSNKYRGVLTGLLAARRDRELVEILLTRHYDPLYRHSDGRDGGDQQRAFGRTIESSDPELAADHLAAWLAAPRAAMGAARH